MTDMAPNLTAALAESERLLAAAVDECVKKINDLPRNPKAAPLSESPKAFVVSSKDIFSSGRWDVFFHDWGAQYSLVQGLLASRRFLAVRKLLEGQDFQDKQHGRVKLAPEVIGHLKGVIGDLATAAPTPVEP